MSLKASFARLAVPIIADAIRDFLLGFVDSAEAKSMAADAVAASKAKPDAVAAPEVSWQAALERRVMDLEGVVDRSVSSLHERLDDIVAGAAAAARSEAFRAEADAPLPPAAVPPTMRVFLPGESIWNDIDDADRAAGGKPPPAVVSPHPGVFGHPDKPATPEEMRAANQAMAGVPEHIRIAPPPPEAPR